MLKQNKRVLYNKILYYILLFSFLIGPLTTSLQNMLWKEVLIGGMLSPLMVLRGGTLVLFGFVLYHVSFPRGKNLQVIYPLFFLCVYVVLMSIFHPYPLRDLISVFRIFYVSVIFIVIVHIL